MPPIRGVIQAATVVWDAVFDNYTFEQWQANVRPKVQGSWNLHCQLPKDMDFFVMLSSIAGLMGHRSQAGYAAGNTFQDALALHRQRQGLPGVAVDLGAMLDVGAVKDGTTAANFSASEATYMIEAELHSIMKMCFSGEVGEYATPSQVCTGLPSGGMLQLGRHETPPHFARPFFAALKNLGTTGAVLAGETASIDIVTELIGRFKNSSLPDDAQILAVEILRARLAKDIQCAADDIDPSRPLTKYGIDSLVAVDLRSWVRKEVGADVSPFDILSARSFHELASKIVKTSNLSLQDIRRAE
ncbi:putative polyketide synthase [Venturia nashicola]|nr:putative polyketide synthase [Venturia nashicola]